MSWAICCAFWLLGKALVTVNLSVGYAIWAALGIVLTSIIAVVMFGEQLNVPQSWVSRSLLPVWCWSTCSDRRTSRLLAYRTARCEKAPAKRYEHLTGFELRLELRLCLASF